MKPVEVPADLGTLQSEYDELKKDQDDLLELLSDQQLKIGIGLLFCSQNPISTRSEFLDQFLDRLSRVVHI